MLELPDFVSFSLSGTFFSRVRALLLEAGNEGAAAVSARGLCGAAGGGGRRHRKVAGTVGSLPAAAARGGQAQAPFTG